LIGLGRIGRAMMERARVCGMEVIATSRSGRDYGTGCPMVSLPELLQSADAISLHSPLTEATRHLLNADAFAQMRTGVVIINTSRGPLIDHAALWDAIQSGKVAGAGLDVFEPEPPDLSLPLYRDERVVVTPHAAFVSEESLIEMRERVAAQIVAVLSGERPENVVNPSVLG
jgi:D-3-phosphoglycerate dehydrogenase